MNINENLLWKMITFDTKDEYLDFLSQTISLLGNYSQYDRDNFYPSLYKENYCYKVDEDSWRFSHWGYANNYLIFNYKDLENPINKKPYYQNEIIKIDDEIGRLITLRDSYFDKLGNS